MKQDILLSSLREGRYDAALTTLYGDTSAAKERAVRLVEIFSGSYPDAGRNAVLFSAPGRTELGGNHTDHQHGHVLCGSVDMDTLACAAPNGAQVIRLHSEGYAPMQITLDDLSPRESERNTTAALIRGVMARIAELLSLVNASGSSSTLLLQNVCPYADPREQAVLLSIALAKKLLGGKGAVRVHGGGFAGTIQAFVPLEMLNPFRQGMEAVLGEGMCHVMRIRPEGGCVILPE